jgi:DNA-binding transcriptional ArsR family regulator
LAKYESPRYTQVPNDLLEEHLRELGHAELKVLLVMFRQIVGYHMERRPISLTELQRAAGLSRSAVSQAVQSLEDGGYITATKADGTPTTYGIPWREAPRYGGSTGSFRLPPDDATGSPKLPEESTSTTTPVERKLPPTFKSKERLKERERKGSDSGADTSLHDQLLKSAKHELGSSYMGPMLEYLARSSLLVEGSEVYVLCADESERDWLDDRAKVMVRRQLGLLVGHEPAVYFVVAREVAA